MLPGVAILVGSKGRGSNMRALITGCQNGSIPAQISMVISPVESSEAMHFAKSQGVPVVVIEPIENYALNLLLALDNVEWICLAGFTRLLPIEVVHVFEKRILNVHPALLPKFGGKGMYGKRVHEAVIAAGETESGCSIHYVNEHFDEGEVVLQMRCPVLPDDTPESLGARVLELEHIAYPQALAQIIEAHG